MTPMRFSPKKTSFENRIDYIKETKLHPPDFTDYITETWVNFPTLNRIIVSKKGKIDYHTDTVSLALAQKGTKGSTEENIESLEKLHPHSK